MSSTPAWKGTSTVVICHGGQLLGNREFELIWVSWLSLRGLECRSKSAQLFEASCLQATPSIFLERFAFGIHASKFPPPPTTGK